MLETSTLGSVNQDSMNEKGLQMANIANYAYDSKSVAGCGFVGTPVTLDTKFLSVSPDRVIISKISGESCGTGVVVGIAGTFSDSIPDWISDAIFRQVTYPLLPLQGMAHSGFMTLVNNILKEKIGEQSVVEVIQGLLKNNTKRLFVTGHSQGGAIAVLIAPILKNLLGNDIEVNVYTYGAPRSCNSGLAVNYSSLVNACYRYESDGDIVPYIPFSEYSTMFAFVKKVQSNEAEYKAWKEAITGNATSENLLGATSSGNEPDYETLTKNIQNIINGNMQYGSQINAFLEHPQFKAMMTEIEKDPLDFIRNLLQKDPATTSTDGSIFSTIKNDVESAIDGKSDDLASLLGNVVEMAAGQVSATDGVAGSANDTGAFWAVVKRVLGLLDLPWMAINIIYVAFTYVQLVGKGTDGANFFLYFLSIVFAIAFLWKGDEITDAISNLLPNWLKESFQWLSTNVNVDFAHVGELQYIKASAGNKDASVKWLSEIPVFDLMGGFLNAVIHTPAGHSLDGTYIKRLENVVGK